MLGLDVLANFPFDGAMDSVRIWRRALSAVQVAALYRRIRQSDSSEGRVSGSVSYDGVVPGPIRVPLTDPMAPCRPDPAASESAFSLSLTDNRSMTFLPFRTATTTGVTMRISAGDHYGELEQVLASSIFFRWRPRRHSTPPDRSRQ